jgi:transposase-like protein
MNSSKFSEEQIRTLQSNYNVDKCSDRAITYSKAFKIKAIKQYNEDGKTASQIFREAGFDLNMIGKHIPKGCLKCWRRAFKMKGVDGLLVEQRGRSKGGRKGRPRKRPEEDKERIKRLEAENAYLKAENDFLAKLRAKKAE